MRGMQEGFVLFRYRHCKGAGLLHDEIACSGIVLQSASRRFHICARDGVCHAAVYSVHCAGNHMFSQLAQFELGFDSRLLGACMCTIHEYTVPTG